jgi:ADP-ribose pyrophosphatase YjhB (NUDIX family)
MVVDHLNLRQRLMRQAFHLYFRLFRGMTLGVRALVVSPQNEVFLVRHTYVPGWYLPGGGVEVGETLLEAITKELREEGNIEPRGPVELVAMFYNKTATNRDHVGYYIVQDFVQTAPFASNREIAEARFFPITDLPEDTTPSTRRRIHEFLNGETSPQIW